MQLPVEWIQRTTVAAAAIDLASISFSGWKLFTTNVAVSTCFVVERPSSISVSGES